MVVPARHAVPEKPERLSRPCQPSSPTRGEPGAGGEGAALAERGGRRWRRSTSDPARREGYGEEVLVGVADEAGAVEDGGDAGEPLDLFPQICPTGSPASRGVGVKTRKRAVADPAAPDADGRALQEEVGPSGHAGGGASKVRVRRGGAPCATNIFLILTLFQN